MKLFFTLCLLTISLYASEYYAKLEPYDTFIVKSAVSGKIDYINTSALGKVVKNEAIIKMDIKLDETELQHTISKLNSVKDMLSIEQKNYDSIKNLTSKSIFEKDAQKTKVLNYETQVADLEIKIATLKDKIENKILKENNTYIHEISVKVGEYVNTGTLLYTAMDFSKGKLEFFIPINDAEILKSKTIFLDGEKTDLKINKMYQVADSTHISSYKCEIVIKNPKEFSKLYKIEFK
jgi:hypothetical protein